MFIFNSCNNPYTHNKTHETNKGQNTSDIPTSERKISSTKRTISKIVGVPFHGRCELDSHADTTVAVKNCSIIKYTYWSFDVSPLSEKYTPMKDILIVSAATGFTSENGINYILVFHEPFYMPNMSHTLINQNQCRHLGEKYRTTLIMSTARCRLRVPMENSPHSWSPLDPLCS